MSAEDTSNGTRRSRPGVASNKPWSSCLYTVEVWSLESLMQEFQDFVLNTRSPDGIGVIGFYLWQSMPLTVLVHLQIFRNGHASIASCSESVYSGGVASA